MRSLHKGLPFLLMSTLLLAGGCHGDSTAQKNARFLKTYTGQYSGAAVIDGQAHQWRLAVHELGAVLTQLDGRDRVSVQDGIVDDKQLTFDSHTVCVPQGDSFTCALENHSVTLDKQESQTVPDLATLAGDYQLVNDTGTGSLTLASSGMLTATLPACSLQGVLSVQEDQLRLQVTYSSCGATGQIGVVQLDSLTDSNDALEVWIPDSPLAGFWLR